MSDTNSIISAPESKGRSRPVAVGLLIALLAGEVVALVALIVVAISSLIYALDLQIWVFDVAKGLVAIVFAVLVVYAIYRTGRAVCRRQFQFSLRTLLVATAVFALLLGTLGQHAVRYCRLHRVLGAGAWGWDGSTYGKCDSWVASRLGYDPLSRITAIKVVKDQALLNMATDIDCFSDVEALSLEGPRVTDAGLAGADALARLPRLRVVTLRDTAVTDAGLESLSRWPLVEVLVIDGCKGITDDGLAHLARMRQLWHVWFAGSTSRLSDAGLVHLCRVPRLEYVTISGVGITDAGLKHLEGMKQWKAIWLYQTAVTEDGAKRLQEALPDCQVKWEPD